MGAWIEMTITHYAKLCIAVAPLVGVWIEIAYDKAIIWSMMVAPLVGVWIEMHLRMFSPGVD